MPFDAGSVVATLELRRDPFQRDLRAARAEGERFERNPFTAILNLNKNRFDRALRAAETRANALARKRFSPTVDANTALAQTKLKAVEAQANRVGRMRETIHVGVNYDRNRLTGLLGSVTRLRQIFRSLRTEGGGWGGAIARTLTAVGGGFSRLGRSMMGITKVAWLAGLFGHLGVVLTGLTASLWQATKGILALAGAVGVAAGGALTAGLLLAVGAVARFKQQADQAGTAAHRLKNRAEELRNTFNWATARGADAVFRGMAQGLRVLTPAVGRLRNAFTVLGQAWGRAFASLGRQLVSLQPSFSRLIRSSAGLAGPVTRGFGNLLRVLTNIARAAMPALIDGARAVARWLGRAADRTRDFGRMRSTINALVQHFHSWVRLTAQVGRIVGGVFRALAAPGKELVDTLAQGARNLADWVNSARGQAEIRKFWADILPLVKQMGAAIKEFVPLFLNFLRESGPMMTQFLKLLTGIFRWLNQHPTVAKFVAAFALFGPMALRVVGPVLRLVGALTKLYTAYRLLKAIRSLPLPIPGGGKGPVPLPTPEPTGKSWIKKVLDAAKRGLPAAGAGLLRAFPAILRAGSVAAGVFIAKKITDGLNSIFNTNLFKIRLPNIRQLWPGNWGEDAKKKADQWAKGLLNANHAAGAAKHSMTGLADTIKRLPTKSYLRILTPGVQQALDRIKHLERFRLTPKQMKVIEKGGKPALDLVKNILKIKLSPKQQQIVERGGKEALALIQRIQARKLAQKALRIAIRHGDVGAISSHLNKISNYKMKAAIKRILERGHGNVMQRLNRLRAYVNLAKARKLIDQQGAEKVLAELDRLKSITSLGTAVKNVVVNMTGGKGIRWAEGGIMPSFAKGGVYRQPTVLETAGGMPYQVGDHKRGPYEVVISGDPSVRRQNIGFWMLAAKLLKIPGFAKGGLAGIKSFAAGGIASAATGAIATTGSAVRTLTQAVDRMLQRFATHTRRRSLLEEMLGTPAEIKSWGKAVGALRDKLLELSRSAVEGFIDMRLQFEQMAIDTGPFAKQLARMKREDTARDRQQRMTELQQQLDDARKAQVRKPGELEADFEERRIQGARDEARILQEIQAERRSNTEADLEAEIERQKEAAERRATNARNWGDAETDAYRAQLGERFGMLLEDLHNRTITIEQFARRVDALTSKGGVFLDWSSDEIAALLGGWPEDREDKKGKKKVKSFVARTGSAKLIATAHGARQRAPQLVKTEARQRTEESRLVRHDEAIRDLQDRQVRLQSSMDRTLKRVESHLDTLPARMPKPSSGVGEINRAVRNRGA